MVEKFKNILFSVLFLLSFIIILFINIKFFIKPKKDTLEEGLKMPKIPSPKEIANKVKEDTERKFKKVGDSFKKVGSDIKGGFSKITDVFKDLKKRFQSIGKGFDNIFGGIGDQFVGLGKGLRRGFIDIGDLIKYSGEFLLTYMICGVKYITNLHRCIFYYLFDLFLNILYFISIKLVLCIIWFVYPKIFELEKIVWAKIIRPIDDKIFSLVGFYFTRWPRSVRDLCYNCKRLKVSVLKRKANDVDYDFKRGIPKLLQKGTDRIKKGGEEIKSAFAIKKRSNNNAEKMERLRKEQIRIQDEAEYARNAKAILKQEKELEKQYD